MSDCVEIEDALVSLLAGLDDGGVPVFAAVCGLAAADRAALLAAIVEFRAPAAVVVIEARESWGVVYGTPGAVRVAVHLAAQSMRSADGARRGDVDTRGVFELTSRAGAALDGVMINGLWHVGGVEERIYAADRQRVIWRQEYLVERLSLGAIPAGATGP